MTLSGFHVTDHALLRWLERLHGIDVDFMRAEMQREVDAAVLGYGESDATTDGAHQFVLEGPVCVTFLRPGDRLLAAKYIGGYAVPRLVRTSVAFAEAAE